MSMPPRLGYDPKVFDPPRGRGPDWEYPIDRYDHWHVTRLELVSLLKSPQPAVYVSDHLPAMQELERAQTRELNGFEKMSLPQLYSGEDIAAEATLNHIHLLGAIRAHKGCVMCHSVQVGDLLGAFTYDLEREPLRTVEQSPHILEPSSEPAPGGAANPLAVKRKR